MPPREINIRLESTSSRIAARLTALDELYEELLLEHSAIEPSPTFSNVIAVGFPDSWEPLGPEGQRVQGRIRRELDSLVPLITVLTHDATGDSRDATATALMELRETADQTAGTFKSSTADVLHSVRTNLVEVVEVIRSLYDPALGEAIFVPDANAVIWNPALEEWGFGGVDRFTIALTSTLLSELDELKMRDRNEGVREKAESAIRRISEYRRRGNLRDGVPLRKGMSVARTFSIEPRFDATLPWLDPSSRDDRLLAQAIEVMRSHPHSSVVLVTRDINLTTKADVAEVPVVEPPDPSTPAPARAGRSDLKILSLRATGGHDSGISFAAEVQNHGNKVIRVHPRARVGDTPVTGAGPDPLDLLVNALPVQINVNARRPEQGDLVKALGDETTLYGEELLLELVDDAGKVLASRIWSEQVYDAETDRERHALQQAIWRLGRGEATPADLRAVRVARAISERDAN